MATIDPAEGRRLFGRDPSCYHNARLRYPQRVFDILQNRCGLRTSTRTFEIGPGTGLASERLLQLGASPLVAVEPDKRLANFLSANLGRKTSNLKVRVATFERVKLPLEWFDLGVSASAFHWVNERVALRKIVRNLRQGGWWAMWWNLFSDGSRTDEFHKATRFLLQELDRSPSSPTEQRPPFALDRELRIANLKAVNAFENIEAETISDTVLFGTERMMQLYSTLSPISRLEPVKRQRLLYRLGEIAERQYGGKVEIRVLTPIYTAQRR
jgi:SAM-dependent methyltransferase